MHELASNTVIEKPSESVIDFAFRVYEKPELKKMCLRLQDDFHANVNILLWCGWLECNNIPLSAQWLDDVLISVDTLSQLTVSRLREVRRAINETSGFTRVQSKLIIKHILNAELAAEKIFLQRLHDATWRCVEADTVSNFDADSNNCLTAYYYLDFLHVPNARIYSESLMVLMRAS